MSIENVTELETRWYSPNGRENALALQAMYPEGFAAIAEFDRIGHLLLFRAGQTEADGIDALVGIALLRRAVTIYAGMRTLFEASAIDPAKLLARAYFELWLNYRCFVYGGLRDIPFETPSSPAAREQRARRYYVAAERRVLRASALILQPGSLFPPSSQEGRASVQKELDEELAHLRTTFPEEWAYFGDVEPSRLSQHVGGRNEAPWYSQEFLPATVQSISALSRAFGLTWEYEFLYDSWSALVHARGIRQDTTLAGTQLQVHHPHSPDWFQALAYWCTGWHGMLLITAAKCYAPGMIPDIQTVSRRHEAGMQSLRPRDAPNMLA